MVNKDTEICICNSLTVEDIATCIKENGLSTLEEILNCDDCPVGDKCESCLDEGYNNDGLNVPMVLSMVQRKLI